jgi:hypothetical protein
LRPKAVIGCKCPVSGMLRKPIFIIYHSRKIFAGIPSVMLETQAQDHLDASRKAIAASGDCWRVMMRF